MAGLFPTWGVGSFESQLRLSTVRRPRNSTRKLVSGPFEGAEFEGSLPPSATSPNQLLSLLTPDFDPTLIPDSHFYVYYPKFLDRIEIGWSEIFFFFFFGLIEFHTVKGNEFDQTIFRRFCRLVSLIFNINLRSSCYLKIILY